MEVKDLLYLWINAKLRRGKDEDKEDDDEELATMFEIYVDLVT